MIDRAFWASKRVFVTGHTGFKGGWLCQILNHLGATVKGYSLPPSSTPNLFEALHLEERLDHVYGNILDDNKLNDELCTFSPDIVFHLAAQPLVRRSYEEPKLTYQTNVIGTLNVYEAARKSPSVQVIVSVTTDKCYENREWVWGYREQDRMGGYDPYSSSKACAELLTTAYRSSFFNANDYERTHHISLSTARAGNVIGGGDWAVDRLLPDCIRSLSQGERIVIRNPHAIRPWQYVLDPLAGYLTLAQRMWEKPLEYDGGWNFGPLDNSIATVEDIVRMTIDAWGDGEFDVHATDSLHEAHVLKLDISKARARLHWKPMVGLKEAVEETMRWYHAFYSGKSDMTKISEEQISSYLGLSNHD